MAYWYIVALVKFMGLENYGICKTTTSKQMKSETTLHYTATVLLTLTLTEELVFSKLEL